MLISFWSLYLFLSCPAERGCRGREGIKIAELEIKISLLTVANLKGELTSEQQQDLSFLKLLLLKNIRLKK